MIAGQEQNPPHLCVYQHRDALDAKCSLTKFNSFKKERTPSLIVDLPDFGLKSDAPKETNSHREELQLARRLTTAACLPKGLQDFPSSLSLCETVRLTNSSGQI